MKNNLRELRQLNSMTQEDLANLLNVSRQTIISIESGRYNPSLELAFRISAIFRLPIEKIFNSLSE
ncbi:MAG: helix-turn-helix transcriptional regulator [Thermincola sp.]|nr:helix-turn-helix transcriptional regulator [Thermincola sp.]MDT3704691.1 helix-turn-helix transcriptional regulator [Thermincola sp.]